MHINSSIDEKCFVKSINEAYKMDMNELQLAFELRSKAILSNNKSITKLRTY